MKQNVLTADLDIQGYKKELFGRYLSEEEVKILMKEE